MAKQLRDFTPDITTLGLKDLKEVEQIILEDLKKVDLMRSNHYWMLDFIRIRIHTIEKGMS